MDNINRKKIGYIYRVHRDLVHRTKIHNLVMSHHSSLSLAAEVFHGVGFNSHICVAEDLNQGFGEFNSINPGRRSSASVDSYS
jgi:hypothetical protein